MVECIFLFHEWFHKSLQFTSTEPDPGRGQAVRQNRGCIIQRTGFFLGCKAPDCSLQHLGNPRKFTNHETSNKFLFHGVRRRGLPWRIHKSEILFPTAQPKPHLLKCVQDGGESPFLHIILLETLDCDEIPSFLHILPTYIVLLQGILSDSFPPVLTC